MPEQMIAIVNNDLALLTLLEDILFEEGYASTAYLPNDRTFYHLRSTQPTLIMLDLGLQESWPGWPLLQMLQGDPYTASIPVLVCTVDYQLLGDKHAYLAETGCAVLELPATFDEIIHAVRNLLQASTSKPNRRQPTSFSYARLS